MNRESPMQLTIFGATGQTGRQVVRQALANGDAVTAVVRDPKRLDIEHSRLTLATIPDLTDTASVARTLENADAAISAIGPRGRKDAPVASPSTRSIAAALDRAEVRRLVVISASPVGARPQGDSLLNRRILMPIIGAILRPVYDDLRSMEAMLAASGLDWTAFRPPNLTNGSLTGHYRTAIGNSVPRGYSVSRADLAHAMLDSLGRPEMKHTAVGIAD